MNTRRSFLQSSLTAATARLIPALPVFDAQSAAPTTRIHPPQNLSLKEIHHGQAEVDQIILALSEPSQAVRDFFAKARSLFETNKRATFAELPAIGKAAALHGLSTLGGPMLGALTHNSARVWVRTLQPASVVVKVTTAAGEISFGPIASTVASDLSAVVRITGLAPATRHPYRVLVDNQPVSMCTDAAISTPPAPDQPGRMTFAFGSCFHKTGLGNVALLDRVRQRGASSFLVLGDSAVDDRRNNVGLHCSDYLMRDLHPGWRDLAATTAIYAAWDDHDYFDDDCRGVPGAAAADLAAIRKVWIRNWNNPAYGFEGRERGIFFRTRLGPCDLIMLDTRSLRTRPGAPDGFLGEEQMRWLEQELAACTGPFVFLTSGTMWSDNISNGKDSWGIWDIPGRERIFALIEKLRLPVMLLSGDRHGARVIRIPRPSGHTLWEFELASLGAQPGPPAFGKSKENQPFGATNKPFFGECTIDTTADEPTATICIVDPHGKEHWRKTFTSSELTPAAPKF
ncbi:MAG: alkaline phosphatase D family protein [Kiritimatiellae bacterium]|nr:alkaline phosphatase D family protein [Kiritimatiellia bacterium]